MVSPWAGGSHHQLCAPSSFKSIAALHVDIDGFEPNLFLARMCAFWYFWTARCGPMVDLLYLKTGGVPVCVTRLLEFYFKGICYFVSKAEEND